MSDTPPPKPPPLDYKAGKKGPSVGRILLIIFIIGVSIFLLLACICGVLIVSGPH
jgi:hypothetical protein